MKRILSIVILTLFLNGNLYAEEISTIIIDKFFQDGQEKMCKTWSWKIFAFR